MREDLWEPLYKMMPVSERTFKVGILYDQIIEYSRYRRACERWPGDSRLDHINYK